MSRRIAINRMLKHPGHIRCVFCSHGEVLDILRLRLLGRPQPAVPSSTAGVNARFTGPRDGAYNSLTMFPPLMIVLLSFGYTTVQSAARPAVEPRSLEIRVTELINAERVKAKLKPLKVDPKLSEIARRHSEDMARRGFFDHLNPDGQGPTERGLAAHYTCVKYLLTPYTGLDPNGNVVQGEHVYEGLAENIFQNNLYNRVIISGTDTKYEWNSADKIARSSVDGWMGSPGHRQNILTRRYEKTGVGIAIAANDEVLITQLFC